MAVIQKMDCNKGYFSSVRYKVPKESLYLCSIGKQSDLEQCGSGYGSDTDDLFRNDSHLLSDITHSDSDSSMDDVVIPAGSGILSNSESVQDISQPEGLDPQRRSTRSRRQPSRFGNAVDYNADIPFSGENETVQNYWPNYPRGTWSPNTNND